MCGHNSHLSDGEMGVNLLESSHLVVFGQCACMQVWLQFSFVSWYCLFKRSKLCKTSCHTWHVHSQVEGHRFTVHAEMSPGTKALHDWELCPCHEQHTSPQPWAEVTLLKAKLIVPPPFPLCVDKEPDKMAVSFVVRGAWGRTHRVQNTGQATHFNSDQSIICHLYGLWYVHLIDFHVWDTASNHVFIVILVAIKEVCGINAHTNCSLWTESGEKNRVKVVEGWLALRKIWGNKVTEQAFEKPRQLPTAELTLGLVLCWSLLSSRSFWRRSYSSRISAGVRFLSTTWRKSAMDDLGPLHIHAHTKGFFKS